jgi:hypothetical protein
MLNSSISSSTFLSPTPRPRLNSYEHTHTHTHHDFAHRSIAVSISPVSYIHRCLYVSDPSLSLRLCLYVACVIHPSLLLHPSCLCVLPLHLITRNLPPSLLSPPLPPSLLPPSLPPSLLPPSFLLSGTAGIGRKDIKDVSRWQDLPYSALQSSVRCYPPPHPALISSLGRPSLSPPLPLTKSDPISFRVTG